MSEDRKEPVEIKFDAVEHETEKAYQIRIDMDKFWMPKSQIQNMSDESLEIPRWLAEDKGLV